jgi:hypothetical protein
VRVDRAMPFRCEIAGGYMQGLHNRYLLELARRNANPANAASAADIEVEVRYRYNPSVPKPLAQPSIPSPLRIWSPVNSPICSHRRSTLKHAHSRHYEPKVSDNLPTPDVRELTICFSKSERMHDIVIGLFINGYEFQVRA